MAYTVVGLLGRGGMAVVELAIDEEGREVARKRVSLGGSAEQIAMARQRIRREAEVLASLHHPAIVELLAVEDDGTDVVLVMPRLVESLADRVCRHGPLAPSEVAAIGQRLLDALATAHRQGVVHRDIKPANVLFDAAGQAALADFGVARTRMFTPGLTVVGTVIGTPEFIAPEQAAGKPATAASDVFSLGATLGYALTGRGPYGAGEPLALMGRAARGDVDALPPSIPAELRHSLAGMLDPRPERRPTAAFAGGGPSGTLVDADPPQRRQGGKREARRGRAAILALALVTAVAVAWAAYTVATPRGAATSAPSQAPATTANTRPGPTTTVCTPLLYEPCGQTTPAFGTDGTSCLPGHADFDGILANGCEAVSDYQPGQTLRTGQPVEANLVPADSVATYQAQVSENLFSLCLTKYRVTLVAPAGTSELVEIVLDDQVLASAVSANGRAATASASKPACFDSGRATATVRVSTVSGASASDFRLVAAGGW